MPRELITLRDSLSLYEKQEDLLRTALRCYGSALVDVEQHIFHLYPKKLGIAPPSFEKERRRVAGEIDTGELEQTRQRLSKELREASARLQEQMAGAVELSDVLSLLEQTAKSLRNEGETREKGFSGVAESLKSAAQCQTVDELKSRLQTEVGRISELVNEMKRENANMLRGLDKEMSDYRRKLDEAERMASSDALTGLENRRGLEARVRLCASTGIPYTIMIIDLNRFKQVNDKFGHLVGDRLLAAFGLRLKSVLTSTDHPARWGGDEFVVLMESGLRNAITRARLIERQLTGAYRIDGGSGPIRLEISLSIGLAEARTGETAEQVFTRADSLLYREKQKA